MVSSVQLNLSMCLTHSIIPSLTVSSTQFTSLSRRSTQFRRPPQSTSRPHRSRQPRPSRRAFASLPRPSPHGLLIHHRTEPSAVQTP
ncbi:hypothetical protein M0R45_025901 [Rubus argutus]|uniref:Uncharacterized protein n=1 Tax=Rubus argutus TaxID=59490 RepID=A0AAW1WYC7_RUBAR